MKIIRVAQSPKLIVHKSFGLPIKVPIVYLRFGLPPEENRPSRNWLNNKDEKGVSVYRAWFDPKVKKFIIQNDDEEDSYGNLISTLDSFIASNKRIYLVNGHEINSYGSDNEVLLDPETVKVVKEVSRNDIVEESTPNQTLSGESLSLNETPNYDNETNWEIEDGLKGFKMPKVEIKPRIVQVRKRGPWRGQFSDDYLDLSLEEQTEQVREISPLIEVLDRTVYDIYINGKIHRPELTNYSKEVAIRVAESEIQNMISKYQRSQFEEN